MHGVPRVPDDWTSAFEGELFADRGFTGHQHLREFDLINMNGRVYDPVLARFLSPDPFVQFPGMADGLNRYSYVMNNPLIFTDPSGYMPHWVQHGYDHYYRNGGGGTGFNYFGWIERSMNMVERLQNKGPSMADYDNWVANFRGKEAFGRAGESFGYWYQHRRNLKVNWEIVMDMAESFLSTDYQYGGNDLFYANSDGSSGYGRSKYAVLADLYSDMANLSYMEQLAQSPRNYGMMFGDPEKSPLIPGIYETSWKNLGYHVRNIDRILEGNTYAKDDPSNAAAQRLLRGATYTLPVTGLFFGFIEATTGKDPIVQGSEPSELNRYKGLLHMSVILIPINRATTTTQLLIYSTQELN